MDQQNTIINLKSLFDLSEKLNSANEEKFIFNSVLLSIMGKLAITKAAVFVPESRLIKPFIIKGDCDIVWAELFDLAQFEELDKTNKYHANFINCGYKYAFPIRDNNVIFGIVFLGSKITKKELSDIEIQYGRLVTIIASIAINNTKNYQQLNKEKIKAEQKTQLLETLFSISKDFSLILSKEQIINMLTYSLMGQLVVNKFAIVLQDESNNPEIIANRFGKEPTLSMLKEIIKLEKCSTIEELTNDGKIDEQEIIFLESINAGVLSPMQVSGVSKGWLILGEKLNKESFTEENLQFIEAIGNTSIIALENERLVHQEIKKKQLEKEMNLALDIQKNLLPKNSPQIENYDIYGMSLPSRSVGGDYFDHIKIDDNRILLLIADVSGKGLPAAMIMANLQSSLRLLAPMDLDLNTIINSVSKLLFQNTSSDKFVTMFLGILDIKNHKITYSNAGHNPPYLIRNNKLESSLSAGGLILGLLENDIEYEVGELTLEKGDLLFLYTDGITENKDSKGEEYGEDRLQKYLESNSNLHSKELLDELVDILKIFSFGSSQYDDITGLALKYN
ncbi:PP2C family protein-serine/threonine phosphatase [Candidatus Kapabacteria bacterium]|nr:PP2C family protein-serine/threonine phosphatase [Candidatus Kapabacteria bacterium]